MQIVATANAFVHRRGNITLQEGLHKQSRPLPRKACPRRITTYTPPERHLGLINDLVYIGNLKFSL